MSKPNTILAKIDEITGKLPENVKPVYTPSEIGAEPSLGTSDATKVLRGDRQWVNIDSVGGEYVHPNHTGHVVSAGDGATTIQPGVVTKPMTDAGVQSSLSKADTALQTFTETDPTVPAWAKNATKPTYTIPEITNLQNTLNNLLNGLPVWDNANYKLTFTTLSGGVPGTLVVDLPLEGLAKNLDYDADTNEIILTKQDNSTLRVSVADLIDVYTGIDSTNIAVSVSTDNKITATLKAGTVTETQLVTALQTKINNKYDKPGTGIPLTDLAAAVQTSLGKANTALQSFTETDPTVPAWAKAATKPTYTAAEVNASPAGHNHDLTYLAIDGTAVNANIAAKAYTVANSPADKNKVLKAGQFVDSATWGSVDYSELTGVPASFTPSSHNHDTAYRPIGWVPSWTDITSKPGTFAPIIGTTATTAAAGNHNHDAVYLSINGTAVNAAKVNNLTVETAVPVNAKFTDTVYVHPGAGLSDTEFGEAAKTLTYGGTISVPYLKFDDKGHMVEGESVTAQFRIPDALTWSTLTGKPTTFAPIIGTTSTTAAAGDHNHSTLYRPIGWVPAWSDVTGKPSTFAPIIGPNATDASAGNHTHDYTTIGSTPTIGAGTLTISQNGVAISNTFSANATAAVTVPIEAPDWTAAAGTKGEIKNKPATFAPSAHNHAISEVTNLQTTLNGLLNGLPVWNTTDYTLKFTTLGGGTATIDLPLESLAKDLGYNSTTKNIVLTKQDGSTINVPVGDLVDTYTNGTGLSLSGNTFNHSNSITAGRQGDTGATRTLAYGGTFVIPSIAYDAQGHIVTTNTGSITLTLPAAYSLTKSAVEGVLTGTITTHNHDGAYRAASWVPAWADVTGKPTTFAPIIGAGATDAAAGNHTHSFGVTSVTAGTAATNGQVRLSVTTNGTTANVDAAVLGLGSAAYTASTAYKASSYAPTKTEVEAVLTGAITTHTHDYTKFTGTLITSATTQAKIAAATSTNAAITLHDIARTGSWADLLSKPTTLAGYGITDAKSSSYAPSKSEVEAVLTGLITTHTHNYTANTGTVTSVATSGAITGGTITTSGTITHSTAAGYVHIPTGGAVGQTLIYSGTSGNAAWKTIIRCADTRPSDLACGELWFKTEAA